MRGLIHGGGGAGKGLMVAGVQKGKSHIFVKGLLSCAGMLG